ncbi:RloB family protein [Flavobacterium amniphilum]|uniref:RloB family protein n=1 Tax=Flavobacterium amniphilum TaxID=1834035 RepID=UPI00202A1BFE|nr:RloB family protein [Flavobacterium amniphilum]MCL9804221.1 RloB family protein [Flavobacterium amniphilum]
MNKPWELKTSSERSSETLFTFHLFCEDTNSEPIYFKNLESGNVKIITHIEQGSMFKNLINTISKCKKDGFLKKYENRYVVTREGIEVWCVFDRDRGANGEDVDNGDVAFDLAINTSISQGLNIAWSNDAFELWILLHLMEIPEADFNIAKNREYYYSKLKEYFENHPNPNEDLKKALQYSFGYKHSLKSANNFRNIVMPEIKPLIFDAIRRAKLLEMRVEDEDDFSQKAPCTLAYRLVERILEER